MVPSNAGKKSDLNNQGLVSSRIYKYSINWYALNLFEIFEADLHSCFPDEVYHLCVHFMIVCTAE